MAWVSKHGTNKVHQHYLVWCIRRTLTALWKTWHDIVLSCPVLYCFVLWTWHEKVKEERKRAFNTRRSWSTRVRSNTYHDRAIGRSLDLGTRMASNICSREHERHLQLGEPTVREEDWWGVEGAKWSTNRHSRWRKISHVYASYFPGISGSSEKHFSFGMTPCLNTKIFWGLKDKRRNEFEPVCFCVAGHERY